MFYLLPEFPYRVIGVLVFYMLHVSLLNKTQESVLPSFFIFFSSKLFVSIVKRKPDSREERRGKQEDANKGREDRKGGRKKSLHILKGLHCFSVILVPHWTHEEFCNTHNKEMVVGDTWRRTIKNNNEKKIYKNNCASLEV